MNILKSERYYHSVLHSGGLPANYKWECLSLSFTCGCPVKNYLPFSHAPPSPIQTHLRNRGAHLCGLWNVTMWTQMTGIMSRLKQLRRECASSTFAFLPAGKRFQGPRNGRTTWCKEPESLNPYREKLSINQKHPHGTITWGRNKFLS